MGFYGNITNTGPTHFQFDKIFPNRRSLDIACLSGQDNIYSGRFVLVSYDPDCRTFIGNLLYGYQQEQNNSIYMYADIGLEQPYIYTTFNAVTNPTAANWDKYYWKMSLGEGYDYYFKLPSSDSYSQTDGAQLKYYMPTADQAANPNLVTTNQLLRKRKADGTPTESLWKCINSGNAQVGEIAEWEEILPEAIYPEYIKNYNIDREFYGTNFDLRGYDATVWQKIYSEGEGKFILIAHLSAVIPSFELVPDSPSAEPISPYIDTAYSDASYRIHVPAHWGFRIKEAEEITDENDQTSQPYSDQTIVRTRRIYGEDNEVVNEITETINADIYYNKKASNPASSYKEENISDAITLSTTGESGRYYYDNNIPTIKTDTLELSIHLPMIGNMVSEGYDIIYGKNKEQNEDGSYTRTRDIKWYDGDQEDLKKNGDAQLGRKSYDLDTIAGSLNTIHCRLGQIIVPLPSKPDSSLIANYSDDYIYYMKDEDKYYRKGIGYNYTELTRTDYTYTEAPYVTQQNYISDAYYLDDQGQTLATGIYENTTYYKRNIKTDMYHEVIGGLMRYDPNQFFLKRGSDYIRDTALQPSAPNQTYYQIDETSNGLISFSSQTDFDGQYAKDTYYYLNEHGDYIRDGEDEPTYGRSYYNITIGLEEGTTFFTNTIFYDKNNFYYYDNELGIYQKCSEYNNLTQIRNVFGRNATLYWLKFKNIPTIIAGPDGETTLAYELDSANPIGVSGMSDMPNDTSHLYCMIGDDYVSLSHLSEMYDTDENQTPFFAQQRTYTIITTELLSNLYVTGKYYYLSGTLGSSGDFILSYDNLTDHDTYYSFKTGNPSEVSQKFYLPNTYYYEESQDSFTQDPAERMMDGRTYYTKTALFVVADYSGRCPYGYEWRDYTVFVPASITLAKREEVPKWIEIKNFADGSSTINGFLLQLEKYLEVDNSDTRDNTTFRGALNLVQDYLYNIRRLTPNQLLYINDFGQISAAGISYKNLLDTIKYMKDHNLISDDD